MKNSYFRFIIIIILLVAAFYLGSLHNKSHEEKLAQDIKSQLRNELRSEIKQELLAELTQNNQKLVKIEEPTFVPRQAVSLKKISTESLDQAVHRVSREAVKQSQAEFGLSDQELDQYVASGGIEPNLPVASGYTKNPDMVLAQNNSSSDEISKDKNIKKVDAKTENNTVAGEGQRAEAVERTLQQRGSMLLGKGKWIIEPSTSWAHFSSNKINLQGIVILDVFNIGVLGAQEINRDIFNQTLNVKYGLMNNLQTEVKIPFRGEYDRVTDINANNRPTAETTRGAFGLGDIDLSMSRQIGWEEGWKPDLIAAIGFKTKTGKSYGHDIFLGSGHNAFRTALIASKSSDPAVIFGSLSYTYNFERTGIEGLGDIKPGDVIGYSLGTAIALSYQTAINFSFDNSVVMKSRRNGETVLDSFVNTANFRTGLNWAIDEHKSVNVSVSFGLTKDSPDVTVDIGMPIAF